MILNDNAEIAKKFYRTEREELIKWLWEIPTPIPLSTDMVLCLANRKSWHEQCIIDLEPVAIKMILDRDLAV